nr:9853_t:CDS:2 [Entrophospora candida]
MTNILKEQQQANKEEIETLKKQLSNKEQEITESKNLEVSEEEEFEFKQEVTERIHQIVVDMRGSTLLFYFKLNKTIRSLRGTLVAKIKENILSLLKKDKYESDTNEDQDSQEDKSQNNVIDQNNDGDQNNVIDQNNEDD